VTRRRTLSLGGAIAVAVTVATAPTGCRRSEPPAPAGSSALSPLRVSIQPYLSYLPVLIAKEEGFYRRQGLEVEFAQLDATDVLVSLLGERLDVGILRPSPATFNAILRGGQVRIVADKGKAIPGHCASVAFLARRQLYESGRLEDPRGLAGLRVAILPDTIEPYLLRKLLTRSGLTVADVERPQFPGQARAEALERDLVDIVLANEPQATALVDRGLARPWVPVQDLVPNFQLAMLLYGPRLLEREPDLGHRFMAAYLAGVRQYLEGPTARNLEIAATFTGLEPEFLRRPCWAPIAADGHIDIPSLLGLQSWWVESGQLVAAVPVERFWNPAYVDAAARALP
jgi:NitT/TauT family transport system substrate-binding protein